MLLILKKSVDGVNVLKKVFTDERIEEVTLKRDFDLLSPVLYLRGEGLEAFNYFELPEIGRSYYVNNYENLGNNLFRIMGSVDVLTTYEEEILNANSLFNRKIKVGDYINASVDYSVLTDVVNYDSDVVLNIEDNPIILTTIGSKGVD